MKIKFISILLLIALYSCHYNDAYKPINHNNEFQISIPGWVKNEKLAEDAVVSYANRYRNFYLIVLEHDKSKPVDTMNEMAYQRVLQVLDSAQTVRDTAMIDSLQACHYSVFGKMGDEKEKIYYELYIINGRKKYYEVCIWTRGQERHKKYMTDFYTIIHSFKEI